MRLARLLLAALLVPAIASFAFADATVFIGTTTMPSIRAVKGFSIGSGFVIVGWEFEYADTAADLGANAPSLRTGTGNVYLQTPVAIRRLQPYFITGGGLFRESLGTRTETSFSTSTGGGVKITLTGPLRARVDYRVFNLQGNPLYTTVHRLYGGLAVKF